MEDNSAGVVNEPLHSEAPLHTNQQDMTGRNTCLVVGVPNQTQPTSSHTNDTKVDSKSSPPEVDTVPEDPSAFSVVSLGPPPSTLPTYPQAPSSHLPPSQPPSTIRLPNMDGPSMSISALITRRGDLPHPQQATPNRIFKVVFLGDSGVGKTSLIHRLSSGEFNTFHSTLGLDFSTTMLVVREEKVVFQLWDTAGQER